jgi:hypothetical protein
MRKIPLILAFAALPAAAAAAPADTPRDIADKVSQSSLENIVTTLVGFGTRHTLSSQTDPKRGIGAALHWGRSEFRRYGLTVEMPEDVVTGERVLNPTRVVDVLGIQKGREDPQRVVIIAGHIDSRVTDVMNASADAPGANDDGSGSAAVIEAARVLSRYRFPVTIVYALLSGEEQGLLGGKILADFARSRGWQVMAVLNNDIVGNSCSSDGVCDAAHVRVFSEGVRSDATDTLLDQQRSRGGENDSPSRNLSRFIDSLADDVGTGLDVRPVWRRDRFGRGGDHIRALELGFPAVRFTVAIENYNRQHQDLRVENGITYGDTADAMDFAYLARVTQLNVATLAALARAPRMPAPVAEGAVSTDTTIEWATVPRAKRYRISWRPTDAASWTNSLLLPAGVTRHVLKGVRVDDWVFGVSAISGEGYETPVASAVPGGAFGPLPPPDLAEKPAAPPGTTTTTPRH